MLNYRVCSLWLSGGVTVKGRCTACSVGVGDAFCRAWNWPLQDRLLPGARFESRLIYQLFWQASWWFSAVSRGKCQDTVLFPKSLRTRHLWTHFQLTVPNATYAFETALLHTVRTWHSNSLFSSQWVGGIEILQFSGPSNMSVDRV
jgi:hypothetical protein